MNNLWKTHIYTSVFVYSCAMDVGGKEYFEDEVNKQHFVKNVCNLIFWFANYFLHLFLFIQWINCYLVNYILFSYGLRYVIFIVSYSKQKNFCFKLWYSQCSKSVLKYSVFQFSYLEKWKQNVHSVAVCRIKDHS